MAILVINPNTTQAMTEGMEDAIKPLGYSNVSFYTAPDGVPSINNEDDAAISSQQCLIDVSSQPELLDGIEAVLVCCYSQHPLVPALRAMVAGRQDIVVIGIFEASIAACLQSIDVNESFGIVSTGEQWQAILNEAVAGMLGSNSSTRYAGTETTGLNATELHTTPQEEVVGRMKDATKRLLSRKAKAICLGCAGMAGMDRIVRQACIEFLGEEEGRRVTIVDGVISGLHYLQGVVRARRSERQLTD